MNFLRRGSKKSLVKTIDIRSDAKIENERVLSSPNAEWQLNLLHQPEPALCDNINTMTECLEKTEKELQRLKIENIKLDNVRISLEDRTNYFEKMCNEKEAEILSLSTKIEVLKLRNDELESERSNEAYVAKSQYMSNLEEELKRVNEESRKTISHLHKKMKRLQENHAKSKQDYALKVFALKDEKNKLMEDNLALEDRLRGGAPEDSDSSRAENKPSTCENIGPDEDLSCTPRNKLIIQLSQQVTRLDVENQELKQELEKTKSSLQKFELKERTRGTRTSSKSRSKARHEQQQLCVTMAPSLDLSNSTAKLELQG